MILAPKLHVHRHSNAVPRLRDRTSNLRRARAAGSIILKTMIILALAAAVFGGGAYFAYTLFVEPDQNLKKETAV
jgi:hypothetical protein